ncbi:hypothetical protein CK910_22930 [Aeromonas sp. CA23]|uniref:hypothetical protein n=1 Tax=Aeromonas sp. CA23 TaxID=2033032 RepID=UPI000BFDB4D3|nr:hypothetical protein [Aeromonas sp. CA23]ATM01013.1 hypothetical protein CK910_22930 [Aeromonas sp. CA23]
MTIWKSTKPKIYFGVEAANKIVEGMNEAYHSEVEPGTWASGLDVVSKAVDMASIASSSTSSEFGIEIYLKNSDKYVIAPVAVVIEHMGGKVAITEAPALIYPSEGGRLILSSQNHFSVNINLTLGVAKDTSKNYYPISDSTYMTFLNFKLELNAGGIMNFDIREVGVLYADYKHLKTVEPITSSLFETTKIEKKEVLTYVKCSPPIGILNAPAVGVVWKSEKNFSSKASRHVLEFI